MEYLNREHKSTLKTFIWIGIFSAAFGFLEAIIVIYLRQMYYPGGFVFPLVVIPQGNYGIELIRETATIIMLVSIGMLTGKNAIQRWAYFLYAFGVWDIFFYIGLKSLINWPPSLLTWDLLFLIPVAWDGPVLTPLICSLTMIFFAGTVMFFEGKGIHVTFRSFELGTMLAGILLIFISFIRDYSGILIRNGYFPGKEIVKGDPVFQEILSFAPSQFSWIIFLAGEICILSGIIILIRRVISTQSI